MVKILISIGLLFLVLGILYYFFGNIFSWMGKLPGDIRVEKENFRFYFPITTSIVISIILSLIIWILRFLYQK